MAKKRIVKMKRQRNGEAVSDRQVTAPIKWQSDPSHPMTHLAYITDAERELLANLDLHKSGVSMQNQHFGPKGIPSLNGAGDVSGGYGGADNDPGSRGGNMGDRASGASSGRGSTGQGGASGGRGGDGTGNSGSSGNTGGANSSAGGGRGGGADRGGGNDRSAGMGGNVGGGGMGSNNDGYGGGADRGGGNSNVGGKGDFGGGNASPDGPSGMGTTSGVGMGNKGISGSNLSAKGDLQASTHSAQQTPNVTAKGDLQQSTMGIQQQPNRASLANMDIARMAFARTPSRVAAMNPANSISLPGRTSPLSRPSLAQAPSVASTPSQQSNVAAKQGLSSQLSNAIAKADLAMSTHAMNNPPVGSMALDPTTSAIAQQAASVLPGRGAVDVTVDPVTAAQMQGMPPGFIGPSPSYSNSAIKGSNLASPLKSISRTRGIPGPAQGQFTNMAAQAPSQNADLAGIRAVMQATNRSANPFQSQRTSVAANAPDSIMGTPEMAGGYSQTPEGSWTKDAQYSGSTPMEAVGKMGLFDQLRTGAMFSGFGPRPQNDGTNRGGNDRTDPFRRTASLLTAIDRGPIDPRSFWRKPRF